MHGEYLVYILWNIIEVIFYIRGSAGIYDIYRVSMRRDKIAM